VNSFANLISYAEDFLTLVALCGAVWSAYLFVSRIYEEKEEARRTELSKWRKSTVQKLMMTSPEFLSTQQITTQLRDPSFEQEFDIKKSELTEQDVRLLLVEMVSDQILFQLFGDMYGIQQQMFDPSVQLAADNVKASELYRAAYNLITRYPAHYTDEKLFEEIGQESGFRQSDFALAISDLRIRGIAEKNEKGAWVPKTKKDKGDS
jgi:hypothetical protein